VRGIRVSEFSDEAAVMSMMMEVAVRESILRNSERVALPLEEDLEAEEQAAQALMEKNGVDPMDVEGMLNVEVSRP